MFALEELKNSGLDLLQKKLATIYLLPVERIYQLSCLELSPEGFQSINEGIVVLRAGYCYSKAVSQAGMSSHITYCDLILLEMVKHNLAAISQIQSQEIGGRGIYNQAWQLLQSFQHIFPLLQNHSYLLRKDLLILQYTQHEALG